MKLAVVLPLALVLALLLVVPVSADKPVVSYDEWDVSWMLDDPAPCPGIDVWDRSQSQQRTYAYYDHNGTLLRTASHAWGTDTLYSPQSPGVELTGNWSARSEYDYRTGTETLSGAYWHITVPGYGTVAVLAGRLFPDGRLVGVNSFTNPKDMEQLCAILAGD